MEYTIKNDKLIVKARTLGAELQSIQSVEGIEYLWQADPAIWGAKAHNIFPYVGRLTGGKYTLNGNTYEMKIHGIARYVEFSVEEHTEDSITLRLDSNEETKKQYPYDFIYRITYKVEGNSLVTINSVENKGNERMYFAVGGHPGFNVPMDEGLAFEDYYLEFSQKCQPSQMDMSDDCFMTGTATPYPLQDNKRIYLQQNLFDRDAIVLRHMDRTVKIGSDKGKHSVTVSYPDFQYVGFWNMPKKIAPYVCVEPWSSLPSRSGIVEDFAQQGDLISVDAGATYTNTWTITVE